MYARFLLSCDDKKKVVISVPNKLLADLMRLNCNNDISHNPEAIYSLGTSGIHVCTHAELLSLSDEVLEEIHLAVDEFHKLLDDPYQQKLLCKVKHAFALSATLGGSIGH